MDNMKAISVSVKVEQLEKLQTVSTRTDVPVAALIRRGIDLILAERKADWNKK
jgi:Ribbon-helix-helix domain